MNNEDYLICNDSFGLIHMKSLRLLRTIFDFYDSILRSAADFKYFLSKKDKRGEAMEWYGYNDEKVMKWYGYKDVIAKTDEEEKNDEKE